MQYRSFQALLVLSLSLLAPFTGAKDPETTTSLGRSIERLRLADASDARRAAGNFVDELSRQERLLCEAAEGIITKPDRTDEDEVRFRGLLEVLASIGRGPTIKLLAQYIDYQDASARRGTGREEAPEHDYPCLETLVRMKGLSLPSLAEVLASSDDERKRRAALRGLVAIGALMNEPSPRDRSGGHPGEPMAKAYLQALAAQASKGERRARLSRAVAALAD